MAHGFQNAGTPILKIANILAVRNIENHRLLALKIQLVGAMPKSGGPWRAVIGARSDFDDGRPVAAEIFSGHQSHGAENAFFADANIRDRVRQDIVRVITTVLPADEPVVQHF